MGPPNRTTTRQPPPSPNRSSGSDPIARHCWPRGCRPSFGCLVGASLASVTAFSLCGVPPISSTSRPRAHRHDVIQNADRLLDSANIASDHENHLWPISEEAMDQARAGGRPRCVPTAASVRRLSALSNPIPARLYPRRPSKSSLHLPHRPSVMAFSGRGPETSRPPARSSLFHATEAGFRGPKVDI